jgi:shikimate dehydrogenase
MNKMNKSPEISGTTRVYAIIADPIHHVKTPETINRLFASRGEDRVMVPFHVSPADLPGVVAGLRGIQSLDGFIVTVPHKTAIVELCDSVSAAARLVGAVNVVRRTEAGLLHGDILDGAGFVAGLQQAGIDPRAKKVYLAGAGGAANAIAFALAAAGVLRLTIYNRTRAKAEELVARIGAAYPGLDLQVGSARPDGDELLINGTSLGLREADPLPFDVSALNAAQTVAEIIMQPAITPLLRAAAQIGCRTHEGLPMLLCQIELMAAAMATDDNENNHA